MVRAAVRASVPSVHLYLEELQTERRFGPRSTARTAGYSEGHSERPAVVRAAVPALLRLKGLSLRLSRFSLFLFLCCFSFLANLETRAVEPKAEREALLTEQAQQYQSVQPAMALVPEAEPLEELLADLPKRPLNAAQTAATPAAGDLRYYLMIRPLGPPLGSKHIVSLSSAQICDVLE